ncbi:MAG: deferrochelatase/peroxidase EfeB [Proteobacteria bacterium]|nr:deferrochelatase/peroxidase EfeB [Pseudomonadota bacterium]
MFLARGLAAGVGGLAAGGLAAAARAAPVAGAADASATPPAPPDTEPFWGVHQGGIATPTQLHTYFAAFDLTAKDRAQVEQLLRDWTQAAARMAAGHTAAPLGDDPMLPPSDSGEALGLPPARLTLTFGFGPGLFVKDGKDRYGLAARRPAALVDLPRFNGDQLQEARCGGDLSVQACADDPQVAFHAVRQLARIAYGVAEIRWVQTGFSGAPAGGGGGTPRNLMGFKDGTRNPRGPEFDRVVWVGEEGPAWMRNGSYLVARRIRISLEHWDRTETDFQEQVVGRHKMSGAPLGGKAEFDTPDFAATDKDGNPVIPEDAHIRLGAHETNGGAQMLRRAYAYNDGANVTAERWPPWRQGMMYDAGLFFLAYQKDPRAGFIRVFEQMAKLDALNQFTTHVGSAIFAIPPGAQPGGFIGQGLFVAA